MPKLLSTVADPPKCAGATPIQCPVYGLLLSPLLFTLHLQISRSPISTVCFNYHLYAFEEQLYLSFPVLVPDVVTPTSLKLISDLLCNLMHNIEEEDTIFIGPDCKSLSTCTSSNPIPK